MKPNVSTEALEAPKPFLSFREALRKMAHRGEWGIFLAAFGIGIASVNGSSPYFPPVEPERPFRIALTFDDGPHPGYALRLLEILHAEGARATFFVVGRPALAGPSLLDALRRRGHELGNHTMDHHPMTAMSGVEVLSALGGVQTIFQKTGTRGARQGKEHRLFRPPGGRFNADVLATARAAGYHMVLWSLLPKDHENPPAEKMRREILARVADGDVLLLHSGIDATLEMLPDLLRDLTRKGFRCVTVGELMERPRPTDPTAVWLDAPVLPGREATPLEETAVRWGDVPS